ncbi:MAG: pyrroline-5-carboxylate reductase family protein [Sphingomonadaceae bacterium]
MIGCGNMAGAMLSRWLDTGLDPARVTVIDPANPALPVRVLAAAPDEAAPDILLLGVKPQLLGDMAPGLRSASDGALVLSILAGTTTATLRALFPDARGIVRIMPNLPVALGKGAVALFADAPRADCDSVAALVAPLGLVEWISDESLFDAVTALSGSGPAFVYRFIDALAQGGAALGLPADQAMRLAVATVDGAATSAAASALLPADLAEHVASKGGSTRAGLDVIDDGAALAALVARALAAAQVRNGELAALTRPG